MVAAEHWPGNARWMARLSALILLLSPGGAMAQTWPPRDPPARSTQAFTCGTKRYCTEMTSCAEAMFHFQQCGLTRLDGDRDGVPCERLCGQGSRGGSTRRR
ncbi:excalibur calcium-binding domain-containing protein [Roseomonas eburnea]|uniref:Excalibur calcium-binding domain-containing protein n=1 Tax=Neoroseomonas eburnea TaxID=1346889 RepID=A0A9X9X9U1_9PROT|nr:excalibur calcium-binding domain-containing protein [Neoroseomonas eburnea]MBR0680477.1 excalibur calcium-binding domain-containing protein [Neoroseomonas eburnea]